ncbi:AMP-dependent synthetase/ligase [Rhabdothermincola salaria]|uniref:AMP-dependent synthetase/ligase n=1 Tax=Rhabdothermincola salaria TaxID=2903142 RepID=UPI001E44473D|nr:AMP-dependent synthetase/ligase [Rhabdothermincola salaria]MCD9624131.1 AMP-dependent synthetase/ligase [Rhabdothermincola salaria]
MAVTEVTESDLDALADGRTIPGEFAALSARIPDQVALRWRGDDETWHHWTYAEYRDRVARLATGLRDLGVRSGDRVVLMLRNVPEFHVVDLAVASLGATPVSIYNSSSPEQIAYLAGHCEAVVAVVEDRGFLDRFLAVRDELPRLRHLVVAQPDGELPDDGVALADLLQSEPLDLEPASAEVDPASLATIIYTSGTTGPPKGVTITHRNAVWTLESLKPLLPWDDHVGKRVVSYLPMAHIAERVTSHYAGLMLGYEVTTCPDPSLLSTYLKEVRPHFLFGVPRVFEKIHAGVNAALGLDPEKKQQFDDAIAAATPIARAIDWGEATEEQLATWAFLDEVAFRPVRELVGLDQVLGAVSGAAPIPAEVLTWFRAIGVPMSEIYGMSESTGPMTWTPTRVKAGTVGPAIPGTEVALADDGEVVFRGGNVFGGYLDAPEKTAEALDDDGWLHSGDIGVIDEHGYLRIVDRKKELIITAGGKNVSPANLEASLKLVPLIGQACAIGDKRPFVSALVTLDPEVAPVWAKGQGIEFDDLDDLAAHPEVVAAVDQGVREVMAEFNNAEAVKKVAILGEEWLPDTDVLTPTSKLKRRGVHARYADRIEALYA